jgi:hypothetical protein
MINKQTNTPMESITPYKSLLSPKWSQILTEWNQHNEKLTKYESNIASQYINRIPFTSIPRPIIQRVRKHHGMLARNVRRLERRIQSQITPSTTCYICHEPITNMFTLQECSHSFCVNCIGIHVLYKCALRKLPRIAGFPSTLLPECPLRCGQIHDDDIAEICYSVDEHICDTAEKMASEEWRRKYDEASEINMNLP